MVWGGATPENKPALAKVHMNRQCKEEIPWQFETRATTASHTTATTLAETACAASDMFATATAPSRDCKEAIAKNAIPKSAPQEVK